MKPSVQPAAPAAASLPRRPGQTLKLFAAAIFLAFVLPMMFLAGLLAWHQYRILTTWPAVDAVVTSADWTTFDSAPGHGPVYGVRFSFRYAVAGRVYEAGSDLTSLVPADAERWAKQMPAGSHQHIRYDPHNPTHISLTVDYTPGSFAAPYTLSKWAGVVAALCVFLLWLGWRAGKRESGAGNQ